MRELCSQLASSYLLWVCGLCFYQLLALSTVGWRVIHIGNQSNRMLQSVVQTLLNARAVSEAGVLIEDSTWTLR